MLIGFQYLIIVTMISIRLFRHTPQLSLLGLQKSLLSSPRLPPSTLFFVNNSSFSTVAAVSFMRENKNAGLHNKTFLGMLLRTNRLFSTEKQVNNDSQQPAAAAAAGTATKGTEENKKTELVEFDEDDYDNYEEPTTAAGKVKMYATLGLQIAFLLACAGCIVVLSQELFPGRMNPNTLFSETFDIVRFNDEVRISYVCF